MVLVVNKKYEIYKIYIYVMFGRNNPHDFKNSKLQRFLLVVKTKIHDLDRVTI